LRECFVTVSRYLRLLSGRDECKVGYYVIHIFREARCPRLRKIIKGFHNLHIVRYAGIICKIIFEVFTFYNT
jgi:hypothetical protein